MTDEELRAAYMAGAPGALAWPWPEGLRAVLALGQQAAGEPAAWSPRLSYPGYEGQRVWANGKPRQEDIDYWAKVADGVDYAYITPPAAARVPLTPDRDKLHRAFRDLGYTTNGQTSDLLDLVFGEFEAAGREGDTT